MNIDKKLCARAMDKAGEEPITQSEWEEGTGTRVRLIKDVYHSTILEALAGTEWTSQKKRVMLEVSEEPNHTDYLYKYILPTDCAKPCSLRNNGEYLVEGNYLYTNCYAAVLVYVSNGYTGEYKYEYLQAEEQPTTDEEIQEGEFYIWNIDLAEYQKATTYTEGVTYYIKHQLEEDYPLYNDYNFDPLLSEYIETVLAQKIVLKLTGDLNKYQLLYSEARLMENRAIKATVAQGHNKDRGNPYWGDVLGLPKYGEE